MEAKKYLIIALIALITNNIYSQDSSITIGYHDETMTYYDYAPDTLLFSHYRFGTPGGENLYLDINKDDSTDFKFNVYTGNGNGGGSSYITITPYNQSEILFHIDSLLDRDFWVDSSYSYQNVPKPYNNGDTINGNLLNYTNSEIKLYYEEWNEGGYFTELKTWISSTTQHIGVRINVEGIWVYGWIKLHVLTQGSSNLSLVVEEYAFSENFNTGIIEELPRLDVELSPNPFTNQLKIELDKQSTYQVRIFDFAGKEVLSTSLSGSNDIIATEHLPNGIYLLQIESEDGLGVKKIVKSH